MSEKVMLIARPLTQDETNEFIDRKGGMRLNSAMKGEIITKAMAHAFDKRIAAMLKEEQTLGRAFFMKAFGPDKLRHALALGQPFVSVNEDFYGKPLPDGVSQHWRAGGQTVAIRMKDLPLPNGGCRDTKKFTVTDEKLVARCRAWQGDTETFHADHQKAYSTLQAMLASINTFKSLQTTWPEGKPFYKHLPKAYPHRHQVPATLVSDLNKALGI